MTTCPQGHQSSAEDYCDVCGAPITAGAGPTAVPLAPAGPAAGAPAAPTTSAPAAPGARACPHCAAHNVADALFCEACGYDFTTGTMPRPEASSIPTPTRPDELEEPPPAPAPTPAPTPVPAPAPAAAPSTGPASTDAGGTADAGPGQAAGSPAAATPDRAAGTPDGGSVAEWVAELWIDPDWYACQNSADPMPSPGLPEVVALRGRSLLVGRVSRSRNIHPDIDCEADSGVSRRQAQLSTDGTRWFVEDLQSANGTFVGPASGPLPKDPIAAGQRTEIDEDDRIYVGAWTRMVIRRAGPGEVAGTG